MSLSGAQVTRLGISGYSQVNYGDFSAKVSVADTTAPTLLSAIIAKDVLRLNCDEAVQIGAGGGGGVALTLSGGALTATFSHVLGATVFFTLSRTPDIAETGTGAYTQPGNGIKDLAGNDLVSVPSFTVTVIRTSSAIHDVTAITADLLRGITQEVTL